MGLVTVQDEQAYGRRQFRGLLIFVSVLVGIATLIDLVVFLLTRSPYLITSLLFDSLLILVILLAWLLFTRRRISYASLLLSGLCFFGAAFVVFQYSSAAANGAFVLLLTVLAPVVAMPYVSLRTFRWLSIAAIVLGCSFASILASMQIQQGFVADLVFTDTVGAVVALMVLLFLLWQFSRRQRLLVDNLRRSFAEVEQLRAGLEQQVASRTAELEQTLASLHARTTEQQCLLDQLQQQQALIQQLSVPVLPISPTTLILPLVGALDPARLDLIRQHALAMLEQQHARTLILDLTGVPEVDTQAAQGLLAIARATYLMGSSCVLAGMRPELAHTLVTLGVDLRTLRTFATLQRALDVVR